MSDAEFENRGGNDVVVEPLETEDDIKEGDDWTATLRRQLMAPQVSRQERGGQR
jgi:hypothetical protein